MHEFPHPVFLQVCVTRHALGADLKSPHIFLDAGEDHALWKGQPSMLVGSPGSSIASTAQGAGDAGDRLNPAIIRILHHQGAPSSPARLSESATPHTHHGYSRSGEPS